MIINVEDGHVPKRITGYVEYLDDDDEYYAQLLADYLNYENLYLLYRMINYMRIERIDHSVGAVRYFTLCNVTIYPYMLKPEYMIHLNGDVHNFRKMTSIYCDNLERGVIYSQLLVTEYDAFLKYAIRTLINCKKSHEFNLIRFFTRNRVTIMPYMFRGDYGSWLANRLLEYNEKYKPVIP